MCLGKNIWECLPGTFFKILQFINYLDCRTSPLNLQFLCCIQAILRKLIAPMMLHGGWLWHLFANVINAGGRPRGSGQIGLATNTQGPPGGTGTCTGAPDGDCWRVGFRGGKRTVEREYPNGSHD